MSRMDKIPVILRKTFFEKVFSIAEYSNMTKEEKTMYNTALKHKWENQNVLDYAVKTAEEGIQVGIKEERTKATVEKRKTLSDTDAEKRKIALDLKKTGMPSKDIARILGLSTKEVEQL